VTTRLILPELRPARPAADTSTCLLTRPPDLPDAPGGLCALRVFSVRIVQMRDVSAAWRSRLLDLLRAHGKGWDLPL